MTTKRTDETQAPLDADFWFENENQAAIHIRGYGDYYSKDTWGNPILLERREDGLYLVVWADINQQDPTHVIRLEGARESARKAEAK